MSEHDADNNLDNQTDKNNNSVQPTPEQPTSVLQVAPREKWGTLHWMGMIIGGTLVTLFIVKLLFSPSQNHATSHANNIDAVSQQEVERQLQANMQKLKEEQDKLRQAQQDAMKAKMALQMKTSQALPITTPAPSLAEQMLPPVSQNNTDNDAQARAYQARLSAPTNMLSQSSSNNAATNNNATNTAQGNNGVFASGDANTSFGNQATQVDSTSATKIAHPDFTIASGEMIQASLETAINSDLPGMVRAVTTVPVYAYTGTTPLIPAGSRLLGQYSSGIVQGQSRVMVVWNRVILPNGITVQINSPSTDNLGMAGQGADSVNRHFWEQFGQAFLLSILSAGASTAGVSNTDEYNSAAQYRSSVSESLSDSAESSLNMNAGIKPTIKINQGTRINIFVARDLDFYSALAS